MITDNNNKSKTRYLETLRLQTLKSWLQKIKIQYWVYKRTIIVLDT